MNNDHAFSRLIYVAIFFSDLWDWERSCDAQLRVTISLSVMIFEITKNTKKIWYEHLIFWFSSSVYLDILDMTDRGVWLDTVYKYMGGYNMRTNCRVSNVWVIVQILIFQTKHIYWHWRVWIDTVIVRKRIKWLISHYSLCINSIIIWVS